jgi:class 3 adenylate cyclase/tetratricopeptide (TPR) repeat protein
VEKILTSKSALQGERKQVTVLFADLRGSMELLADRDPEDARSLVDPVIELMMEAVHRYEGTVNQVMGDGIMALFGAPLAHEDHAIRACYAALHMQGTVKRHADEVRVRGASIQMRVGLNSGEVVVRSIGNDLRMDYTAVGQTTHLAARMEQLAPPGSTLLTPDTVTLIEGFFQVRTVGPMTIKGMPLPIEVFELTGPSTIRSRLQAATARGLTPFVGRHPEMDELFRALEQARGGDGQVVAVVGQPGVGKSRLFYEFTHSARVRDWLILEARSSSFGRATNYGPLIQLLKDYFKISERDGHQEVRARISERLALDGALCSLVPAFLSILGVPIDDQEWLNLEPPQRRHTMIDAVKRLLLRESEAKPVLLVFEDLHWCDSESQALLDSLIASLQAAPLLLLVNYRPEYTHRWAAETNYSEVRLDALPAETTGEFLEALLGQDPTVRPLKPVLAARAEGNPFFLEESVRALVESKALLGQRGRYRLTRSLGAIQVPPTVQAILAARIDRLPSAEKALLQSASVIGRDVPFNLLQAIANMSEDELRQAMSHLQAGEFVYETHLFPELEYTFKHAFTHEVAYGSLLHNQRRMLHAQILRVLDASAGVLREPQIERLAHHAFQAELWPEAASYLRQAGLKAFTRSAHYDAASFFEQALLALGPIPDSREKTELMLDIRFDLRHALQSLGEFDRLYGNLRVAEQLADAIGDQRRLGRVSAYLTDCLRLSGDLKEAIETGRRALAIIDELGDVTAQIPLNTYLGQVYYACADYRTAAQLFRRNIGLLVGPLVYERFGLLQIPSVHCRTCLAWCLVELGEFPEAMEKAGEGLTIARSVDHPLNLAVACSGLGAIHLHRGENDQAIRVLEQGLEVCRTSNVPVWFPRVASDLGLAYARSGRAADAVSLLEEAVARGLAMKLAAGHSRSLASLAEGYLLTERLEESRDLATQALAFARLRGQRGYEAWILLLLGQISHRSEDQGAALYSCRQGLEIANELGMRPLIAHLHLWLGRLSLCSDQASIAEKEFVSAAQLFEEMGVERWRLEAERLRRQEDD